MARIRTIKPEFWTHEDLSALPEPTHMLAAALLNHADDEGFFNANPGLVKAACSPLREPSVSIHDSLNQLVSAAYISLCVGKDGKRYGRVLKFDDHQRVNRPTPSKIKALWVNKPESVIAHTQLSEESPPERNREQGKEQVKSSCPPAAPKDSPAERLAQVTDEATAAYNTILAKPNGLLPKATAVGRDVRMANIRQCAKTARDICETEYGSPTITAEFWTTYFLAVSDDDFLCGKGPYTGAHANWTPTFDYLTRKKTMSAVFEKASSQAAA